jgi:4-hydroxy-3-methylbut-2-en-1-yl diphosphate reductase
MVKQEGIPPSRSSGAYPRGNIRTREVMAGLEAQLNEHYKSSFITQLRIAGGTITVGGLTVQLATTFGFCHGVQRAIDMAYATRRLFPYASIYLLGEIIHNPSVNSRVTALGIRNLLSSETGVQIEDLRPDDIVIIPAFGAEINKMKALEARGCRIVDTTCGDVMSVWKHVRRNVSNSITTIIHGNAQHEETRATISRAHGSAGAHYLVVGGIREADIVCKYIIHGGDDEEFLKSFARAHSPGFQPDLHLRKVGLANQTTMLSSETQQVQSRLRAAIEERDGDLRNFHSFDGICRATQERQDSLRSLLESRQDLLLIIGGYNSSNTSHLVEIGERRVPTYFIEGAECLLTPKAIRHFDRQSRRQVVVQDWLPTGMVTVGVTAGASCPDALIEGTIKRLIELRDVNCEHFLP